MINAPLNDANDNCEVNFLEYWEIRKNGETLHLSWVTDLPLNQTTIRIVMRGGKSRWWVENETFNTLKNQGYHFEHYTASWIMPNQPTTTLSL